MTNKENDVVSFKIRNNKEITGVVLKVYKEDVTTVTYPDWFYKEILEAVEALPKGTPADGDAFTFDELWEEEEIAIPVVIEDQMSKKLLISKGDLLVEYADSTSRTGLTYTVISPSQVLQGTQE